MKKLFSTLFLCFIAVLSFGQTQQEMNLEAHNKYIAADKELNISYQRLLKIYKADTLFIKNIKSAQKIWLQLRDAEMNAVFPDKNRSEYGSVFPMCWSMELTELTIQRTKRLLIWVNGIEEGDVCSGSVRIR